MLPNKVLNVVWTQGILLHVVQQQKPNINQNQSINSNILQKQRLVKR